MDVRELAVPDAWEFNPRQFRDLRGTFLEAFKEQPFIESQGHPLRLAQANISVSSSGVLRGVHFADVPPGQAKYVTCVSGAVFDVVVDIRTGSPTFGTWDAVLLDEVNRKAVYVSEGLGHAFLSLDQDATVVYLCSQGYAPDREHGIHPLDEDLGITWPTTDRHGHTLRIELSDKDSKAPGLAQAKEQGLLPVAHECAAYVATLRS